ncbi:MAG: response regulator [Micavibrio sp.]|nr:response regulator [Micavibrio sp.]
MAFNFQRLSVLVVEDTVPMQKLVVAVLETLGVGTVYRAENGEDGFRVFCNSNPDIVLADWHMEPMSGIQMVDKIRSSDKSPNKMVPIVMMSGYSAFQRVSQARDAGVTEFLVKPFSASDLARRIAYVINRPRDFIEAPAYFGPDRRRRASEDYEGDLKRAEDRSKGDKSSSDKFMI